MSMNGPNDTPPEEGTHENAPRENADERHSGEGAASALAHMISRGRQQRHHTGEAGEPAGGRHA